ncbi:hypothetical protein C7382_103142 [Porphyromonas loveana]|uniref:Uncharacterized protein n=1 Tax=Porphyromonas loveana TaxID=1884669 RepID=A0A2U1FML8_9PORP|nr:hypothetical protein C7382_103142 [Porphyromonas loveana]
MEAMMNKKLMYKVGRDLSALFLFSVLRDAVSELLQPKLLIVVVH